HRPHLREEGADARREVPLFPRPDLEGLDGIGHAGASDLLERLDLLSRERHRRPPWSGDRGWLDGALALLDDDLLQLFDGDLDAPKVRIDLERALEVVERQLRLVEGQVDLPVAREDAPVLRVSLDDLVAVVERLVVFADQEVDGRALVP